MEGIILLEGIIALLLKFANILIHTLGLYLLRCLHKSGRGNVQMVYIVNLSLTELIVNIFSFVRNLLRVIPFSSFHSNEFKEVVMYSYILDYAILKFCLYMWMLYITVDRVCGVLLNITYPSYWDISKAKWLVTVTWLIGITTFIAAALVYALKKDEVQLFMIANYFIIIFDFTFVVTAISSYCFIFYKFQKTRKDSLLGRNASNTQQNLWKIFRRSRFYVSVLLISTYIIFTIFPDLMWTFGVVGDVHTAGGFLMSIMYAVSYFADGAIYIFTHGKVKKLLWRKLRVIGCFGNIIGNDLHRQMCIRHNTQTQNVDLIQHGSKTDEEISSHYGNKTNVPKYFAER